MAYHQPHEVIGFHSCEKSIGLEIFHGKKDLNKSNNAWDWLGPGIYFCENNPTRGLEYAIECNTGIQKNKTGIREPFVIGALIESGTCLNLLDPASNEIISQAHSDLVSFYNNLNKISPSNNANNRKLDRAVIKLVHVTRKLKIKNSPYDTIRWAFPEGNKIYETSNFTNRSHIEICVLNPVKIKGYILPRPIDDYNPFL